MDYAIFVTVLKSFSTFFFLSKKAGLGPLILRKRRSKARKAPAPPSRTPMSSEQTRLLDESENVDQTSGASTSDAGNHNNSYRLLVNVPLTIREVVSIYLCYLFRFVYTAHHETDYM